MYIKLSTLGYVILGILGACALVYLIISLYKLSKILTKVNNFLDSNESNLNTMASALPKASENIAALSENLKDVSEVITTTTAGAIDAKEEIESYIETVKDIILIIRKVFFK